MKLCTTEGCDRQHKARGLCRKHYNQHLKANTLPPKPVTPRTVCIYVDCDRPHKAHNLCVTHWRWQRNPLKPAEPPRYCTIEDCDRLHQARGLCTMHYKQSRTTAPTRNIFEDREKFLEEYEFFRSWNMTDERLAECLHITVDALQKRVERWVTPELQVAS